MSKKIWLLEECFSNAVTHDWKHQSENPVVARQRASDVHAPPPVPTSLR